MYIEVDLNTVKQKNIVNQKRNENKLLKMNEKT